MKLWQGVLTGVAAYVFFLLVTAPAAKLLPLLQPRLEGVQLAGVDGSLWSGSAALVTANPVQLQDLQWRFRPLALLLGRAEVALEASWQGRPAAALAGKALFGAPYLADVSATVAAPDVLRWLRLKQLSVEGNLALQLARVQWAAGAVAPAVTGVATWTPARVSAPVELALGNAQLDTVADQGVTRGKLKASGGALLVDADVELKPDGAYRLDAQIQQKGDVPDAVVQFLSTFAEYRSGSYRLDWSDSL
jgi:general secretion pathway protein N